MTFVPSPVLDLDGISQRQSTFRFELLDAGLQSLGDVEVLAPGVSIENNINRKIKRTLNNIEFSPSDAQEINTLVNRLRVWMITQDGLQWPLGIFVFSDMSQVPLDASTSFWSGSMTDQLIILDQPTSRTYSFAPGKLIVQAIAEMLEGVIPEWTTAPVGTQISGAESMTWPPGTTRLDIINDLCAAAGLYSLFFDNAGIARAIQVPDLEGDDPNLIYGGLPGQQKVYRDSIVLTDDLLSAPNRYVVVNNGMTNSPVIGFWDIPSTAPNSKENRGFVVAQVTDKQGIESNAAAEEAAKAIGQADYNTYSWATFDAAPDPRHDTFDIVGWDGIRYREQSWTLECVEGGNHRHELRRIYTEAVGVVL